MTKRLATLGQGLAATPLVILGMLVCFATIVVALALRVVYETVMLLPRVRRVERDGPPTEPEEPWQQAGPSWPEHLVREDQVGRVPKPRPWPAPPPVVHHPV